MSKSTIDIFNRFVTNYQDNELIRKDDSVLVAVSGGADSVALLDLLKRWQDKGGGYTLTAAYYNHRLREESDRESDIVKTLCDRLKIECIIGEGLVESAAVKEKRAVHDMAREMRYSFLMDVAEQQFQGTKLPLIATGHHLDDQVETVLMRLFSGSGIEGIAGIRRELEFGEPPRAKLIRPLLEFRHNELIDYCRERSLEYNEDPSNYDTTYPRNRIRHELVPKIVDMFSTPALHGISRTAENAGQADALLSVITEKAYEDALIEMRECDIVLDYNRFSSYLINLRYKCLLNAARGLSPRHVRFTTERIKAADKRLLNRYTGITELGNGVSSCVNKDRIWIFRQPRNLLPIRLTYPGSFNLPDWGGLELEIISPDQKKFPPPKGRLFIDLDRIGNDALTVEPAGSGDRFQPLGMTGHRKISDFLSENGVPIHRRRYPVIRAEDQIAAVPPFQIAERFKITPQTKRVLKIQWTDC